MDINEATDGMKEEMRKEVETLDRPVIRYLSVVAEAAKARAYKRRMNIAVPDVTELDDLLDEACTCLLDVCHYLEAHKDALN